MKRTPQLTFILLVLASASVVAATGFGILSLLPADSPSVSAPSPPTPTAIASSAAVKTQMPQVQISPLPPPTKVVSPPAIASSRVDLRFQGHYPYASANETLLITVSSYGAGADQRFERLNPSTARATLRMVAAARADGVWLVPISGFRDEDVQAQLFQAQVARLGSQEAAASVSAPPGYSEHHTGYAVDFGDGASPTTDITTAFEQTSAFQWLARHASQFGFELSFPRDNSQGIQYEPWHWRYVGSAHAAATFENARSLTRADF
ncbi:MAG: M15 family metallopeptidase [Cyanobacteria bacterium J06648_11]